MDAAFYVLLSMTQYVFRLKEDILCVMTVVQLFLHFCLNIRKLKQMLDRCFHGDQLLKCCGTSKYKFSYFYKRNLRGKATRVVAEIQLNLEYVDTLDIKKPLYQSHIGPNLQYTNVNYIVSVVSSKRKCVSIARKQPGRDFNS